MMISRLTCTNIPAISAPISTQEIGVAPNSLAACQACQFPPLNTESTMSLHPLDADKYNETTFKVLLQRKLLCQILSHVRPPQCKARLAEVCRLFRDALRYPHAWVLNDCLVFKDAIENEPLNCYLNNETVRMIHLGSALDYLLQRMHVRHLRLAFCNSDIVYEMVLAHLVSAKIRPTVRGLSITGRGKDTAVLPFIMAFRDTLRCLHIGNCMYTSRSRVAALWQAVAACTQLTEFRHLQYRSHVDTFTLEEDVVGALEGKSLNTLYLLGLRNLAPPGIARLLCSIPPGYLKKLSLSQQNVSLRYIMNEVDESHRVSLREFRFGPFPVDGTDDQLAVAIPTIFPNLSKCTLEAQALTFPSATVVDTIDRFLTHLERQSERPAADRTVTLCMSIYNQHIEVLEKVLGRIVREKSCRITPVKYSHVRDGYVIERSGATVVFYDFELLEPE